MVFIFQISKVHLFLKMFADSFLIFKHLLKNNSTFLLTHRRCWCPTNILAKGFSR